MLNAFFTNGPSYEYTCKPLAGISDHEIVYVTSAVGIEHQQPVSRKIFCGIKLLLIILNLWQVRNLTDEFLTKHNSDTPVETLWHNFESICSSCLSCLPTEISS